MAETRPRNDPASGDDPAPASRRRPTHRKGRPTLTRDRIALGALELVARDGHHGLTMRTLATHLGVSARALYNYVADKREVLGLALVRAQSDWRAPDLDPEHWERDLRRFCHVLRDWYRAYPGIAEAAASDDLVDAVHPQAMHNNERLMGVFDALGLSPEQILAAHSQVVLTVSGYSEWMDRMNENPPVAGVTAEERQPSASAVLERFDPEGLPTLRAVSANTGAQTLDSRFESLLDLLVAGIGAQIPRR